MSTKRSHRYTLAEYLELERESEVKYEYWDGEIFAMSGGTLAHDQITGNMFDLLRDQLRARDCTVFTNNMQIKVPAAPPYRYADGSVVCGPVEVERFSGSDLLVTPSCCVKFFRPRPRHVTEATSLPTTNQSRALGSTCSSPSTVLILLTT
jgi:hypothetical protein